MDSAKQQLVDRLKTATNILVTVSRNPSVDQLAACIGLTLLLNKLNKHTVAVFSGQVPSTIEFLKPDETIEKNTNSLRDFIIALDKNKADKLRYKVENNVVRIFITPYKTSISEKDLEFSQGDFNVDAVVALGVRKQEDLDQAITAHGRILHDATVACINTSGEGALGTINWHDPGASSLSELITDLAKLMGDNLLDNQVATALLTGIVAATNRFSNDRTSPQTMSASSALMAAGANQKLVATKLEEPAKRPAKPPEKPEDLSTTEDGTLSIPHVDDKEGPKPKQSKRESSAQGPAPQPQYPPAGPQTAPPDNKFMPPGPPPAKSNLSAGSKLVTEPPKLGGDLSANTRPERLDPVTDPLSLSNSEPSQLLNRATSPLSSPGTPQSATQSPQAPAPQAPAPAPASFTPPPATWTPPQTASPPPVPSPNTDKVNETLTDIEQSVNSPHINSGQLNEARDEVNKALVDSIDPTPAPTQALNAQPLGGRIHQAEPQLKDGPASSSLPPSSPVSDPNAPPPVPPPLPPSAYQTGNGQTPPNQPPPAQ